MTFSAPAPPVVVDASVAVGALTGDEVAIAGFVGWTAADRALLAPPLVWVETANALVRGHRLSPVDVASGLRWLRGSGIETADRGLDGLDAAMVLAERHGLSVYDATYLWLAIDVDGELATGDRALAAAAAAEGVSLALGPASA